MYVYTVQYMCILYHILVLCNFTIKIGLHPTIFTINIQALYMYCTCTGCMFVVNTVSGMVS